MVWVIYLGGYWFGLVASLILLMNDSSTAFGYYSICFSWTILWIGICWRIK